MALKSSLFLIIFLCSNLSFGDDPPILFAKQPSSSVRFISKDGIYTYYVTRSGHLMFSTNYQTQEVSNGNPGTNYLISSSPSRKMLLFVKDRNYLNFMSQREANTIFKLPFGKSEAVKIGFGVNPKLHLDDNWGTWFNFQENAIHFQSLESEALNYLVKLNNKVNPYFIPQVVMLDKELVAYTDLGKDGTPGVSIFSRGSKSSYLFLKGDTPFEKIELCHRGDSLLIGIFGFPNSKRGSSIDLIPTNDLNLKSRKNLYRSEKNDLGNIVCNFEKDLIYFVKNFSSNINQIYEVVSFNLSTKEEKKLTSLLNATQIFSMDDKLLLNALGKSYVLVGRSDYQKDEFKKELEKKKEKK